MAEQSYRQTLEAAQAELEVLLNDETRIEWQLKEIRERSEKLRNTVLSLSALVGEDTEEESIGITDAIRKVLEDRKGYVLAPTNVRTHLRRSEFPLDKYKNALAVIHTTLKRLENQGEVAAVERDGKILYQWIERPSLDIDEDIPF